MNTSLFLIIAVFSVLLMIIISINEKHKKINIVHRSVY